MSRLVWVSALAVAVLITACASGDDTGPSSAGAESIDTGTPPETAPPADSAVGPTTVTSIDSPMATTITSSLPAIELPTETLSADRLTVIGAEEVVFDWTTDRCEDEHIPDIATRASRSADGQAQLTIGHYVGYRMVGPDLDNLASDCSQPQFESDYDPDPAQFNDSEWVGATYTLDGETVYAVIHNEYRGDTHGEARPDQCLTGERLRCLDTSFTMGVSTDGGATFSDLLPAPDHLIATLPYPYDDDGVPSGIRQPSNIVRGPDGFFYLFGNVSDQPDERQWVCAMRTDDLADPGSWRYWDGSAFAGEWGDPYRDDLTADDKCAPLADDALSGSLNESVVFDESIGRYVSVGISFDPAGGEPRWAVYASTSPDLVNWSTRELLLEVPVNNTVGDPDNDTVHAYPALIDPDSASPNFETSDGELHLYMSRFNFGGNSLDRDLVRWPIEFVSTPVASPVWTFDDGSDGGWTATNALDELSVVDGVMSASVTGDDPSLEVHDLRISDDWNMLTIRMAATDGDSEGRVFFTTEFDPDLDEPKSVRIDVIGDGVMRDYTVDLSTNPGWSGIITGLRFDPVEAGEREIDIDAIVVSPS